MLRGLLLAGVWLVSWSCFGYLFNRDDNCTAEFAAFFSVMIATGTTLLWAACLY